MTNIILKVRENSSKSGQKVITIPKYAEIYPGDKIRLCKIEDDEK